MSDDWIIRFEVWVLSDEPMGGHDRFIRSFEHYKPALAFAKGIAIRQDNTCVMRVRYASERNLSRRFNFDSSFVWTKWMDGMDSEGDVRYADA